MNSHVKEVLEDMNKLPLKDSQKKDMRNVVVSGAEEVGVISEKEAKKER